MINDEEGFFVDLDYLKDYVYFYHNYPINLKYIDNLFK